MRTTSFRQRIRPEEIAVLVQATILGFLLGETWYLGQASAAVINDYIQSTENQGIALIDCGVVMLILFAYLYGREGYAYGKKLWTSRRVDLLSMAILGVTISVIVGGVGTTKYQEYLSKVNPVQLMLLLHVPVAIALMLMMRAALIRRASSSRASFFVIDLEITSEKDDLLGLHDSATRFAKRVLNGGSPDSIVFGIDSPWGIGKSSFVNLCCEQWEQDLHLRPIVHRFEPLRYEDNTDLASKFVNELINAIQKQAFVPSIRPLLTKYSRLVKGRSEFSFLGMKFAFESPVDTVETTLKSLEALLLDLDKKIIIVVDDLDRLSWPTIKNILFAIKRSFMLPNVSYVLCYDTENIVSTDKKVDDAEKVKDFLEKFVNVKISLFLDSSVLANYVSTEFDRAIENHLDMDPHTVDKIKQVIVVLVEIFKSAEYYQYQDLVGDIRKLKRLINTLLLFEIEKTDFENSDFNKEDLLHLLLVYVNYPRIFRKIYNTETNGRAGFFSSEVSHKNDAFAYSNSEKYKNYVNDLTGRQKFLIEKLFSTGKQSHSDTSELSTKSDQFATEVGEADLRSRARFNGCGVSDRNLERYLNLIVKYSKPDPVGGYRFYVNWKDKFLKGESLDDIFADEVFNFSKGDFARKKLWNILVNSSNRFEQGLASDVITHLMTHLPDYSFLKAENIGAGSRIGLIYSLLGLLDKAAWGSNSTGRRNNSDQNIAEIADLVFGEKGHVEFGVIDTLAKSDRGPLGLFDLLLFRLYCSAGRNGDLFNLQRAIALHGSPTAPTTGDTTEIARQGMREISQAVFRIFSKHYIVVNKNIFEAIDNLSLDDFAGKSSGFVQEQIVTGNVSQHKIDEIVAAERSHVKIFVVYQLGNSMIDSGVGCGYYDETGANDQKGIAKKINEYLFDRCFNPVDSQINYEYFLDYLLLNLERTSGGGHDHRYVPSLAGFTKVLDKERLKEYWKCHGKSIWALKLDEKEKRVVTSNYIATYIEDLRDVLKELDKHFAE